MSAKINPYEEFRKEVKAVICAFLESNNISIPVSEISLEYPPNPEFGDLSTSIAFTFASKLKKNLIDISREIVKYYNLEVHKLISKAEVVGGYSNFFINTERFNTLVINTIKKLGKKYGEIEKKTDEKILIEHTSVNPNKPWHVGHARNAILGDTLARIYRRAGYNIEVQNYIDDTGKQVADTIFAMNLFDKPLPEEDKKIDRWMGDIYVDIYKILGQEEHLKEELEKIDKKIFNTDDAQELMKLERKRDGILNLLDIIEKINEGINYVMHDVEKGVYRNVVAKCVRDQLKIAYKLSIFYDLLTWESDIVGAGLFEEAMDKIKSSLYVVKPDEGSYKGCWVLAIKKYLNDNTDDAKAIKLFAGMEEPDKVLIRSNGTPTYVAKDIAFQMWKFSLLNKNMKYEVWDTQPNGQLLWTSSPTGKDMNRFARANMVINVIGTEQSYDQECVYTALKICGYHNEYNNSRHFGYAHVRMETGRMSGRKGIWIAVDDILDEAVRLAYKEVDKRRSDFSEEKKRKVSEAVGISAVRYALTNQIPSKEIIFKWDEVLNFEGDTAPYIQYAHVRLSSILRKAKERGLEVKNSNYGLLTTMDEKNLIKHLAMFPDQIENAISGLDPSIITRYAYMLANYLNKFYTTSPVLSEENRNIREARLELVEASKIVMENVHDTLGLTLLEEM